MLAVLVATIMMIVIGIILLAIGDRRVTTIVSGVLVLALCTTGITGYILGSVYVTRGASLARVQNDFTSAVSHELRTPVTSIRLLLESLRDNRLADADRAEVLTLLARETERIEILVGRVLELSKPNRARTYTRDPVDVRETVDEAVHAFDALTLAKLTPITTTVERGLPSPATALARPFDELVEVHRRGKAHPIRIRRPRRDRRARQRRWHRP
jgi:signal transduction histidine kinase